MAWPDFLSNIRQISPDPLSLILAMLIFIPLERLLTLRREQGIFRRSWKLDSIYFLLNGIFIGAGLKLILLLALVVSALLVPPEFRSWVGTRPFWIQLPVVLIISDLGFYSAHRMFHKIPWLWRFHAVHHSIEEMDWLAGHRVHPLDQIITKGASIMPIIALGFSADVIAVYAALYHWQSLLIHSNVKINFGPLARIFASPHFHHWHHANHKEAYDKNFAGQLSFLDALFGTMHMPEGEMPAKYGTNMPVPDGYGSQLAYPFQPDVYKPVKQATPQEP
jgi:sterol desaturase/sphingolipid hydroxylase (fatty acid hydroxylase superfamily)